MTFQEIFNRPGLYAADGFDKGACFEIGLDGVLYLKVWKNKDDINPVKTTMPVYKELFDKDYFIVYTRIQLFKSK